MQPLELAYYAILSALVATYTIFLSILFRSPARKKCNLERTEDLAPTVSIIVPTYNESEVIERRLKNITDLDFPHHKMQVIVADSASTDSTCDLVRRFASEHGPALAVTLVQRPTRLGKADAINEALHHATSEYLVLTDADVTTPPNALSQLISNFRDKTIGAASGVEIPETEHTLASKIETGYKAVYTAVRMAESGIDTPFMCESEFSAYRRTAVKPLRSGCMCDDIELTVGLRSTGFRAVYDSQTVFFEREAGTFRAKLSHKLRRGMANQHALIRTRSTLFDRGFGRYGRIVFPFEFFVHIISPVLITIALALLLSILATSPLEGIYGIIVPMIVIVPSVGMLYSLTKRYDTGRMMRLTGGLDLIAGAAAFIFFQVALLGSLLQLGLRGPRLKWEKISETRNGPSTGTKNS